MKKMFVFVATILISCFMYSCKESMSDKIIRLVNEWEGRKIIYPELSFYTVLEDTISKYHMSNSRYSIITYIDSVGCTSCKLQLTKWSDFIVKLDSLTNKAVPVYLFMHPENRREIVTLLKREKFAYPVCIDEGDSLNILNRFPQDMSFQTFLLDKDNKVVAIGNPVLNPKIRDLYFNIILNKSDVEIDQVPITNIAISKEKINMGNFHWKESQEKEVVLKNIGISPLAIDEISTSCGCITVEYAKKPILPKDSISVRIKYRAERPEYFNKTITIYCNVKEAPFELTINGNAK